MTETAPHEEMLNPLSIAMLEHISALLPNEEKGILSEKGRLNENGRGISDKVFQDYLSKVNGNYKELLNICKETESLLNPEDTESRDNETLKVIRSIRGKVVYNAHKTFAENALGVTELGDKSASNVSRYARILNKEQKNIYDEATTIEREKQRVDELLAVETTELEVDNSSILEEDIVQITSNSGSNEEEKRKILKNLHKKISSFAQDAIKPSTKMKIVAAAASVAAVTAMIFGYMSHANKETKSDTQILAELNNRTKSEEYVKATITQDAVLASGVYELYDESYFLSPLDIPEIQLAQEPVQMEISNKNETINTPALKVILAAEVPDIYKGTAFKLSQTSRIGLLWQHPEWLPLPKENLPKYDLKNPSSEKYLELINFFNVADPNNKRYAATENYTYCNVFVTDVTTALGVPIPRYINGEKTFANYIYDWLKDPNRGGSLKWRQVSSEEAQAKANSGIPTLAAYKADYGPGHLAMVIPGSGEIVNGEFYPNSAQAGRTNFVGGNTYDGFGVQQTQEDPIYFVNESAGYEFISPKYEGYTLDDYKIVGMGLNGAVASSDVSDAEMAN